MSNEKLSEFLIIFGGTLIASFLLLIILAKLLA